MKKTIRGKRNMKKTIRGKRNMKKTLTNIIFGVYVVIAVFVTICLLSYNEFKVTELGNYSLVVVTDNEMIPNFNKGDLLIIDKSVPVFTGDNAFFYDTYNRQIEVRLGKVQDLEKVTETESTYTFEGEHKVSSEYVLGGENGTSLIPGVGTVLNILESKWGFLFIIVLPALLMFFHQIMVVIGDIKESKEDSPKKEKKVEEDAEKKA